MKTKSVRCQAARTVRVAAVVSVLIALLMLAGCGESARAGDAGGSGEPGNRPPPAERGPEEQKDKDRTTGKESEAAERPEDDGAGGGAGARAGNAVAGAGGDAKEAPGENVAEKAVKKAISKSRGGTNASREVILKVRGNEARFAGTCSVGDEKRRIEGRTPERYAFSPDGERLRCELRGEGPGTLNVVLAAGNDVRSVQQSGAGGGEVSLTYTGDRISVYQSSSGSGSQVQSTSVSDVSSGDTSAP